MKGKGIAVCTVSIMLASAATWAQDESKGPYFSPVETRTCNYKEGKGPADFDKAVDAWNKFMDKNDVKTYFAVTLHPEYHGPETFDIGWLGAWSNGEAMGNGMDFWHDKGGEYAAKFEAVVDCDTHSNFATTMVKEPPGDGPPPTMVLTFSDCSIKDGVSFSDVMAGMKEWADYQGEKGYGNGIWMMFPAFGEAEADYDYKLVSSYENYAAVGKMYDLYGNGGGYQKNGELLGGMHECNVSRVYNARVRRTMPDE